jgi:MFS family permease
MRVGKQPKAVWAVAFSCVIAFMGIGLVDPILPALAKQLDATQAQVELLFTSYFFVTGVAMLVSGWVSSRLGPKRTLLAGLGLIVVFSALAGSSETISQIVGFRAGWGLGNALFIATALAVIVGAARAESTVRSCSTRPHSASASRPGRCSAASSARSAGAGRSSAPPR